MANNENDDVINIENEFEFIAKVFNEDNRQKSCYE